MDGYLEVNKHDKYYRYYIKPFNNNKEKPVRKYLRDIKIAENIANHDYADKLCKAASHELKQINALLKTYASTPVEDYFRNLHPGRRQLVSPILVDDEQYAQLWLSDIQEKSNTYPIISPIQTENNETVRSKSEKIIADKLKLSGVPYIYEKPLYLGNVTKYPDFTILNKRTRKEYYWEHMGMMDNPDYVKEALTKLEIYLKNGILPGKNLIITYETSNQPLSVKSIQLMINEYLL